MDRILLRFGLPFSGSSGVTRATVARGRIEVGFTDKMPYIFCQLGFMIEIREKGMTQFASAPRDQFSRITLAICDDSTDLRHHRMTMETHLDLRSIDLRRVAVATRESPSCTLRQGTSALQHVDLPLASCYGAVETEP